MYYTIVDWMEAEGEERNEVAGKRKSERGPGRKISPPSPPPSQEGDDPSPFSVFGARWKGISLLSLSSLEFIIYSRPLRIRVLNSREDTLLPRPLDRTSLLYSGLLETL